MTSDQFGLFDDDEGARRRDEAVARGDAAAAPTWKDRADEVIEFLARARPDGFTSDDVLDRLDSDGYVTHDTRALGARVKAAQGRGLIVHAGYEQSARPSRHRGTVSRWRFNPNQKEVPQ